MPIVFQCQCGRPLRATPESAGKKTRCPACNAMLVIPGGPPKPALAGAVAKGAAAKGDDPDQLGHDLDWSTLEAPSPPGGTEAASPPSNPTITVDRTHADDHGDPPRPADPNCRQYKVLCQKEQGFSGKFNSAKLEEALNVHALRGWSVKSAVNIHIAGHGGAHDEIVIILER